VVEVVSADALTWRPLEAEPFDIVFVDPPYGTVDLAALLASLLERGLLGEHARVFIESDAAMPATALPEGWQVLREQRAGRVRYHLAAPPRGPYDTQHA
jgi:16S rRNA (guanine966-N2)-methyltransferase